MARDSNNGTAAPGSSSAPRALIQLVAFLCELAMLVVLVIGGWGLDDGGLLSIALAIFYPALAVLIWSLWMAPTAARRLADPWRLVAQVALFAATGTIAALGGHPTLGIAVAVLASLVFAATRLGPPPDVDPDGDIAQAGSSPSS